MVMTAGTETSTITKVLEGAKSGFVDEIKDRIEQLILDISNKTFEETKKILSLNQGIGM